MPEATAAPHHSLQYNNTSPDADSEQHRGSGWGGMWGHRICAQVQLLAKRPNNIQSSGIGLQTWHEVEDLQYSLRHTPVTSSITKTSGARQDYKNKNNSSLFISLFPYFKKSFFETPYVIKDVKCMIWASVHPYCYKQNPVKPALHVPVCFVKTTRS